MFFLTMYGICLLSHHWKRVAIRKFSIKCCRLKERISSPINIEIINAKNIMSNNDSRCVMSANGNT